MTESGNPTNDRPLTILVVDDEPRYRSLVCSHLEERHYKVESANNGLEAIDLVRNKSIDLVLMDVMMPVMNGFTATERIREFSDVPILILTAKGESRDVVRGIRTGADDYIVKPFSILELLARINHVLCRSELERDTNRLFALSEGLIEANRDLEEQISDLKDNMEFEAGRALDEVRYLIGSYAHTLKGELSLTSTMVQLYWDSANRTSDTKDIIIRSLSYSENLLHRLLDYARMPTAKIVPFKVINLIEKIQYLIEPRIPSGISLRFRLSPALSEELIDGDIDLITSVLIELIENAVTALSGSSGDVEVEVVDEASAVNIRVTDTGPGIPEEFQHTLFIERLETESGLGIGLLLSARIIEGMGGNLNLISTSNEGTAFAVSLPKPGLKGSD